MRLFPEQEPTAPATTSESLETSGFADNWGAALGLAMAEDAPFWSNSGWTNTTVESQRKARVQSAIESGDIPAGISQFYGSDYDGLAGYAKDELGLEGFMTDEDYREARNAEYKVMRDYSQSVASRADGWGKLGQFAGVGHAMASDPYYAISALTGYGTAATAGQALLRAGLIEAGMEAAAVIPRISFKEDIESEYKGSQAVADVVFAGVGAGLIAGAGKALSNFVSPKAPKDLTVEQGVEVLTKMEKDVPEMTPILNTLKHADPEDNLVDVLKADEAVDISYLNKGPKTGLDPKADPQIKVADVVGAEEATYLARQPKRIEVADRVNALEKTSPEKVARFSTEAKQATKKVKKATKKYNLAKERAAKMAKAAETAGESVTGLKTKKAAEEANKALAQAEATLAKAKDAEVAATNLATEATKTADEGVPRGTPEKVEYEPDTRHPMVVEADNQISQMDTAMQIMEECL